MTRIFRIATFALFLFAALLSCHRAQAQTFDSYGGRLDQPCTAATGYSGSPVWSTAKLGNRWWFCTPAGHGFIAMAMADMLTNGPNTYDCETNSTNMTGAALTWTLTSGTAGTPGAIFQTTVNWTPAAVFQDELNGGGSGFTLTKESSLAAVTAAKEWYFDTGTNTLYVSTSDGNSPSTHSVMNYPMDAYTIYAAKYGNAYQCAGNAQFNCYNWAWQSLKRATAWGFNVVGQDSAGNWVGPYAVATSGSNTWPGNVQPIPLPTIVELKPAEYASINYENRPLNSPIKDLVYGTNNNYNVWRGGADYDNFDPDLNIQWQDQLRVCVAPSCTLLGDANSLYTLAVFTDDNDNMFAVQSSTDFASSDTKANTGWVTLITSPAQTYNNSTIFVSRQVIYPDSKVYSKANATNPAHGTCSVLHPCSLRDYLYDEYSGSISALNTAWGSSYTTFDSSGTHVSGEALCAGQWNGTLSTCTQTLTHTLVSPFSVELDVNGTMQAGDCPWLRCTGQPANVGAIKASTLLPTATAASWASGTVTYSFPATSGVTPIVGGLLTTTGFSPAAYNVANAVVTAVSGTHSTGFQVSAAMASDPGTMSVKGSGTFTLVNSSTSTVNYSTGAVTVNFSTPPPSGSTVTVTYDCCGWMQGGTGLMDESGSSAWVGSSSTYCLEGPDPLYPDYYVCVPTSGDTSSGTPTAWPSDAFPIVGGGISVSGSTGTVTIQAPSAGARTLYNGQSVYISGTGTPCDGGPYAISDSGNTATSFTFSAPVGCVSVAPVTKVVNGNTITASWVNTALGHDLDNWISDYSAAFFKTMHDGWKMKDVSGNPVTCVIAACWPGSYVPNFGIDNFSSYTYSKAYLGAAPFIDGAFIGFIEWAQGPQPAEQLEAYQYATHYLGDIPIFDSTQSPTAQADSDYACYSGGNKPTQSARGQAYYQEVSDMLTSASANGDYQVVGFSWWSWQDFQNINQGIVSLHDNAYDGLESKQGSQACGTYGGYTASASCGGEPGNYSDAINETNGVKAATNLWLTLAASGGSTFSLTVNAAVGGTVTSGDGHINCGGTCAYASYSSGASVTLTAVPDASHVFIGWSGAGCGVAISCTLTVTSNVTVTPIFASKPSWAPAAIMAEKEQKTNTGRR